MKKLNFLFSFICVLLVSCMESGCDSIIDDRIVDWAPAELYITVEDSQGNDLLDTLSNSCIIDGLKATFRGETLEVRKNCYDEYGGRLLPYTAGTRAYLPTWYGLCLINKQQVWNGQQWTIEKTDKFMLYLGEIDGAKDMDEDLTLSYDNGLVKREHIIHYHCSDHKDSKLSCKRWYSLDGKKTESNRIQIVL